MTYPASTSVREKLTNHNRLFVAIPLERHFLSVFSKYRDTHGRIPYLTWTQEKKLHITLLFIGSVPLEQTEAVRMVLADVVQQSAPFSLTLRKVSYAPPEKPADMVWAYFDQSTELDTLAHEVHHRLTAQGIPPADSFKNGRNEVLPHVTLARFKRKDVQTLLDLKRTELEGYKLLVEDVLLIESRSTPQGSIYTTLNEWTLGA
jgi:2'-5' RNA ligase